jgi:putative endonuclease
VSAAEILPHCAEAKPTVYVLECGDGSLYTGSTNDLVRRFSSHCKRKAAKYTRGRLPVRLLAWWHPATLGAARACEIKFKRLSRSAKLALLHGGEVDGCAVYSNDREATA